MLSVIKIDFMQYTHVFSSDPKKHMVICVGGRTGTKAKREQCVILRKETFQDLFQLIERLSDNLEPDDHLFPFPMSAYRRLLAQADASWEW
jgi:hypothetical protein